MVAAIFLAGFALRLYHLDKFPERNRTADEYAWTWSGMTLYEEGTPRAWSWLPGYRDFPVVTWRDNPYRIVKPWLDHPPLYPLYVGAFMLATGARDPFAIELVQMRASTLLLYVASFFLFYLFISRYSDPPLALLALAFWSVAPAAVWNGRLVMAEQLMLPLALGAALSLFKYVETKKRRWLITLVALCALLPLCKAAASAFALWLLAVAILRRERRAALAVVGGGALGLALYAGYGAHFGWTLFRTILRVQAMRFTNFGGFYALVFAQRVVDKSFMYLPFLLGFFTLLSDLRDKRHVELGLFAAIYAACIAFFLPWNEYGWYLIPLYPALAFGLASFVVRAYRDAAGGSGWIWLLFSVTYLCWILCDGKVGVPAVWRWIYLALTVLMPFASLASERWPSRWRAGFAAFVGVQICGDLWYVLRQ